MTTGIPTDDSSIKAIMAQNSTLRASIAQLRKKNAEVVSLISLFLTPPLLPLSCQLRNKLQSSNTNPSSSSASSRRPRQPSSRGRGSSRDRSIEHKDQSVDRSEGDDSSDGEESDRDNSPPPHQQNRPQHNNTATTNTNSTAIETGIQAVVEECITATIRDTVRANPLSEKIPITVLQETIQEIRNELKPHITLSVNVSRNRFHWNRRIKEYSENLFDGSSGRGGGGGTELVEIPSDVKEEIQSVVKKSLSIPAGMFVVEQLLCVCHYLLFLNLVLVYSEMISLTMLALTYTHSRVSILEGTSPPMHPSFSSPPPPAVPYGSPYEDDDDPPYSTSSSPLTTQPTLYHPNDSLATNTNRPPEPGTRNHQRMGTERNKTTSSSSSHHSNSQSQRRTKRY
jgi:hypothetical protein